MHKQGGRGRKPRTVYGQEAKARIHRELHGAELELVRDVPGAKTDRIYEAIEKRRTVGEGLIKLVADAIVLGTSAEARRLFWYRLGELAEQVAAEQMRPGTPPTGAPAMKKTA